MNITHLITLNGKVAMLLNSYFHWKDVTISAPKASPEIAHRLFKKGDMVMVTQFDKYIRGVRLVESDEGAWLYDEQFSMEMEEYEAQDILELIAENGKQSSKGWMKSKYDVRIYPTVSNGMVTYTGYRGDVWLRTKAYRYEGECIDMLTSAWKKRYGSAYTYKLERLALKRSLEVLKYEDTDMKYSTVLD